MQRGVGGKEGGREVEKEEGEREELGRASVGGKSGLAEVKWKKTIAVL